MVVEKPAAVKQEIVTEPNVTLQDGRRKNWFWDYNDVFESDLSANAMLVRLYLARCANGDRHAWPSLNTIARNCKISKPTVIKALKELEEKGWLEKIIRKRPNQEYETTVYVLKDPPAAYASGSEEGGGKADLPPVKNKTGEGGGVVNDVYHLVNQIDNLVKQVDSNNTQITIPNEQEKDLSFVSSLRSDTNDSASAFQASGAAGGSATPENRADQRDSHPRAGAADAAGKRKRDEDQGNERTGVDGVPSSKELIAELVKEYRAVEGVEGKKGDYAFIGALYNRYGYDRVLEAINELSLATAVQEIEKPLLYLKAVVQAIARRGDRERDGGRSDRGSGRKKVEPGMSDWSTCGDKEKKRELLRSLYLS
ncbi:helix-turn-helix domain-containing protein [Desulfofundulus salinus]|nr:helix-turn-helix domain-containing protein [Desulfofundulus salinum]